MSNATDYTDPFVVYFLISIFVLFAGPIFGGVVLSTRIVSVPMYVWTLYGLNTLFFGLALYRRNRRELRRRLRAKATVVDVVRHTETDFDGDTFYSYTPIFRFIDSRTGEEVEAHYDGIRVGTLFDDNKNMRSSHYPIGKTYSILYKLENPSDDVRVDSFLGNYSGSCMMLAVFGGIVFLVSILLR